MKLRYLLGVSVVAVALVGATVVPSHAPRPKNTTIERVVDGDTIVVAGNVKVRLIGVDTPETVKPQTPVQCYGPEASEFTKHLLPPGTPVRLVFDSRKRTDRYGRELAYVYKGLDFVNLTLVEQGYAREDYVRPDRDHRQEFVKAQAEAKSAARGLWSACK